MNTKLIMIFLVTLGGCVPSRHQDYGINLKTDAPQIEMLGYIEQFFDFEAEIGSIADKEQNIARHFIGMHKEKLWSDLLNASSQGRPYNNIKKFRDAISVNFIFIKKGKREERNVYAYNYIFECKNDVISNAYAVNKNLIGFKPHSLRNKNDVGIYVIDDWYHQQHATQP